MFVYLLKVPRLGYLSWLDHEAASCGFSPSTSEACLFDTRHAATQGIEALRNCGVKCPVEVVQGKLSMLFEEN